MSIEKDLSRIADAVESILAILKPVAKVETLVGVVTPNVVTKAETAVEVKQEMKVEVEPTEEEIRTAIREYMNTNGKDKAISLLIKYGAKAEKPMIKDVTNKFGLMAEVKNG